MNIGQIEGEHHEFTGTDTVAFTRDNADLR